MVIEIILLALLFIVSIIAVLLFQFKDIDILSLVIFVLLLNIGSILVMVTEKSSGETYIDEKYEIEAMLYTYNPESENADSVIFEKAILRLKNHNKRMNRMIKNRENVFINWYICKDVYENPELFLIDTSEWEKYYEES